MCNYAITNYIEYDISNETNIIYDNKIDARISFIRTFQHFDLIIVVIAIYISTTILTEELNKKTIKNLLTKPHKRSTILLSKIIACLIIILLVMLIVSITQYIIGGVIFGFESYKIKYIGYDCNTEQVIEMSLLNYIIIVGISKIPMYIIVILLCVFIGVMNNHISMSMIITLITFIISNTVIRELSKSINSITITRFLITNNWDFSQYLFGQVSDIEDVTIYNSIIICLVHSIILCYLSIYNFNKKDINNV